jgi:hypothetical protein
MLGSAKKRDHPSISKPVGYSDRKSINVLK